MIVGKREESVIDNLKRYLREAEVDRDGFMNELRYAERHNNAEYRHYNESRVRLMENTIGSLQGKIAKCAE